MAHAPVDVRKFLTLAALLTGLHFIMTANLLADESFSKLNSYVDARCQEFGRIPAERRDRIQKMAEAISGMKRSGKPIEIVYICTHNSRRSHFGQVWGAVAADHYQVKNVRTFSGGTEATACNPRTIAALERAGFSIRSTFNADNPRYFVRFAADREPALCYSKKFDAPDNPSSEFIAVMTCSDADEKCPMVIGAAHRFALTYDDPKQADDTPEEASRYDERCQQIAREMLFLFSQVEAIEEKRS